MGEKLKEARIRLGYSEKEASIETRIPLSVLAAFEADDFSHVGAYVYASGFLKRYCLFLGLDAAPFLDAFRTVVAPEEKFAASRKARATFLSSRFRAPAVFAAALALLFLVGYVGSRLIASYSAPRMVFGDGGGNKEVSERVFVFSGKTHPEADLTLNGRSVYLDESGGFEERVALAEGLNAFEFTAKNKFGKITKVIRYIVVK